MQVQAGVFPGGIFPAKAARLTAALTVLSVTAQTLPRGCTTERRGQQVPPYAHKANPPRQSVASTRLERLATLASAKKNWPALRRYAESAKTSETHARAYLVLGYNEFA